MFTQVNAFSLMEQKVNKKRKIKSTFIEIDLYINI